MHILCGRMNDLLISCTSKKQVPCTEAFGAFPLPGCLFLFISFHFFSYAFSNTRIFSANLWMIGIHITSL